MRVNGRRGGGSILALLALSVVAAAAGCARQRAVRVDTGDGPVYRIPVTGTIELGLAPFVERSLREAEQAGAPAAVLVLETPGGRIDAAQRIVDAVDRAKLPVYAFVDRRAYSAGAMIALAADSIFMVPGAVMGAATPVTGEGHKAPEKIVSAMRSQMRALAEEHGLDPAVAEAMVDEDVAIPDVVQKGKLLTLTTDEAVAIGYAHRVDGWDGLMAAIGDEGAPVVATRVNWAEGLVRIITNPILAPILLSLGFLGLLIEIKTPTFGLAGLVGAGSLALFFGGHYLAGLAGSEELILLVAGLVLLGIEVFLVPGFGIFGVLGIGGIAASIYLSLVGELATFTDYTHAAAILSTTVIVVAVAGWALLRHLPASRRFLKTGIFLGESTNRDTGYLSSAVRPELIGMMGVAVTDLHPAGVGRFAEERLDVVAEEGWIEAGTAIELVRAEGYRHVVRQAPTDETEQRQED
ncbi:MAG: NfeD family protein [Gemmatimonadota bacterium]|jgi:membrane-bound serine protease (ClpP class)